MNYAVTPSCYGIYGSENVILEIIIIEIDAFLQSTTIEYSSESLCVLPCVRVFVS